LRRLAADIINIHGGGAYGDKQTARRFWSGTLTYSDTAPTVDAGKRLRPTPQDLLPICRASGILWCTTCITIAAYPTTCQRVGDGRGSGDLGSRAAVSCFEPVTVGTDRSCIGITPISTRDVPDCWRSLALTVEVEAKAKELAVIAARCCTVKTRTAWSCKTLMVATM
jgi:UV DNA damage endonuclease